MLFSIIVPVYNVERYLEQCINSILEQSYKDFELILVDDGSKDNSLAVCDTFVKKDSRVKVYHKSNGGSSDARNFGTLMAKGKYIIYIDSDDYVGSPDFLSEVYSLTQNGSDVIIYKFQKFYENTKRMGECKYAFPDLNNKINLAEKINYLVQTDSFYCSPWSKAIRREILVNNNIEFEKGLFGEDQEWYYHVLSNIDTLDGIDKSFIVYRQRENSVTSSWKMKNLSDNVYVVKKWSNELMRCSLDDMYKEALLNSVAKLYCNLLIGYCKFNDINKKRYYNELKQMSYLLKYDMNPRVKIMHKFYRILGFGAFIKFLTIICKIKQEK